MNGDFQVTFTTTIATPAGMKDADRFRVVIANPGFSTHSSRHGMRNVFLQVTGAKVRHADGVHQVTDAKLRQRNQGVFLAPCRGGFVL